MADPITGAPIGGPVGGPAPGYGFPGIGGGIGLDIGGGLGGLGGLGFGGPGLGGFAPYVPVTPLGAYGAFKGDLIFPIVAIGVAIFILIIIVLAVKAALLWKVNLVSDLMGAKGARLRRSADESSPLPNQEYMTQLTSIVMNALESESCLDKIICSIGSYGKGSSWPSYVSMMQSLMAEDYKSSLKLLNDCAEGKVKAETFQCGRPETKNPSGSNNPPGPASPANATSKENVKSNEV